MPKLSPVRSLAIFALAFAPLRAAPVPSGIDLVTSIILTPQGGTAPEDLEISRWQDRARGTGASEAMFERLGWAYIAKARRTLDAGYYKLAEKTADVMDVRFHAGLEGALLRGHVLHNLHRFREAETVARELVARRGGPADYALLSDALMEQGRLAEAGDALQRMVNLRPGAEASSRIAHLRWLKGDLQGATLAMEEAARASSPREGETHAWLLTRLSGFFLQGGRVADALALARSAEKSTPDYPPALLALGRALLALGRTDEAVGPLQRAADLNPLPEYQWWLADTLRAAGRADAALTVEVELKRRGDASDPRTCALFLATRGEETARAVRLARQELLTRTDVLTHDALAWALAAGGDLEAADTEIRTAFAEGTRDARLFLHAAEIARARGRPTEAEAFFALARPLSFTLTPSEARRVATPHEAVPGGERTLVFTLNPKT